MARARSGCSAPRFLRDQDAGTPAPSPGCRCSSSRSSLRVSEYAASGRSPKGETSLISTISEKAAFHLGGRGRRPPILMMRHISGRSTRYWNRESRSREEPELSAYRFHTTPTTCAPALAAAAPADAHLRHAEPAEDEEGADDEVQHPRRYRRLHVRERVAGGLQRRARRLPEALDSRRDELELQVDDGHIRHGLAHADDAEQERREQHPEDGQCEREEEGERERTGAWRGWRDRSGARRPPRAMTACIPTSRPIRAIMMRWPYACATPTRLSR